MLSDELKVETVESIDAFTMLKGEWGLLLNLSEESTFFLTWDWMYAWWEHFGADQQLFILTVKSASNELLGVAPFYFNKKWEGLPIKALCFIGSEPISSEYLDIICVPEFRQQVASSLAGFLIEKQVLWDCIALDDTLKRSVSGTFLQESLIERGLIKVEGGEQICPYLDLPLSEEALFNKLDSSLRSTIVRKSKKMQRKGISFNCVQAEELTEEVMQGLFKLHQKCWNARGLPGTLNDEGRQKFHLDIAANLFSLNNIRLYTLSAQGRNIAVLYGFQYEGCVYYFQSGYDTDWREYSPGTLLMWHAMNSAIEEGVRVFDFLRGDEPYKKLWTKEVKITKTTIFHPKNNIKMSTYFQFKSMFSGVKRQLKSVIFELRKLLKHHV